VVAEEEEEFEGAIYGYFYSFVSAGP